MTDATYTIHTTETAPDMAADALRTLQATVGVVPNLAATMAESPALLNGFLALRELYTKTGLSPAEVQVLSLAARSARCCSTGGASGTSGFPPMFRESALDDRELAPVWTAIEAILKQQEPYPAVVMNRHWDILTTNRAATRFFDMLLGGRTPQGAGNILRPMFHPDGLRPFVENWEAVAQGLVRRVHREAVGGALDAAGRAVLAEVLDYPGVPARWRTLDFGAPLVPVLPVSFRHGEQTFHFFSAVTVLGTAQDITLQELRVECFFPLDDATTTAARRMCDRAQA